MPVQNHKVYVKIYLKRFVNFYLKLHVVSQKILVLFLCQDEIGLHMYIIDLKVVFIRCYFRGDVTVKPSFQSGIMLNIRPKVEKGWDKEFPYFVEIDNHHSLSQVAQILYTNAYPLSEKKKRGMNSSETHYSTEEISQDSSSFSEGKVTTIAVNRYERNAVARKICIEHYGYVCQICNFDFYKFYGSLGEGLIHVHRVKPLSQIGEGYQVDPIADLIPVCPNCHAVIHRKKEAISIDEIKSKIKTMKAEQQH